MSLKERDRVAIFRQVEAKQMGLMEASRRLRISYRQAKRLWQRYRGLGDAGLVHGLRGRPSNNVPSCDGRREQALRLYREHYQGFGPTLAAELMGTRDGLAVNHETLRGWLMSAGLWKARRQPRRRHRRRERRACLGELVQLDGSDHAWFGAGHANCTLMVMVDDATSRTHARLFDAETTEAAMTVFRQWTLRYGLPGLLYPDRHSIYRRNDKQADEIAHRTGKRPPTRFGEAMADLGVELICAHSPQAKGRVERANGTFQDRLVKMLILEGITTIEAANDYLDQIFLPDYNARFAVKPAREQDAHRPAPPAEVLDAVLCPVRERRVVDKTGCVTWRGRHFQLTGTDATPNRRRQVIVRQRLDGRVELTSLDGKRLLSSRELPGRPTSVQATPKPTAEQRPPEPAPKPAANHPWRKPFVMSGSATARSAPLRSTGHHETQKGTLLLG